MRSLNYFIKHRTKLYEFIIKDVHPRMGLGKIICISAPVKSGKRGMSEIITLVYNQLNSPQEYIPMFVSAFHRKSDDIQRDELKRYGLNVHTIINDKHVDKCISDIERYINLGKIIIL